jgi:D-alanyl-D-alanine dipeptidase
MLLLSDPKIASVPVLDCRERLVDVRQQKELLVDTRKQDSAGAWARLRTGVLERLLVAQNALPEGLRLLIIEGHRPLVLQRHYFVGHREDLRRAHSSWTPEQLDAEASKHVSPPAVAPHPCGAAVDLSLWCEERELDLGTPVNATPEDSQGACFSAAANISTEARHWRNVLGDAMSSAGLVNYPPEWWHWSYGDRYWAAITGAPAAVYAPL